MGMPLYADRQMGAGRVRGGEREGRVGERGSAVGWNVAWLNYGV